MIRLVQLKINNFKRLQDIDVVFPGRCCVLIEGLNEAGKSSLFEAIYTALYGNGLVMRGGGRGSMESLIKIGEDTATIELVITLADLQLTVERRLKRGRQNDARLLIQDADGTVEEVRGISKVNRELLVQLSGLDSEALLASAFVQQKKLGQLEELGKGKREAILLKLLDLDRITMLKGNFRWKSQHELTLENAKKRYRLVTVIRQHGQAEDEYEAVCKKRLLATIHARLDDVEQAKTEAGQAKKEAQEHARQRDELSKQIEFIGALDHALGLIERIAETRASARRGIEEAGRIKQDLDELKTLEQETLPAIRRELEELFNIDGQLEQLEQLEADLKHIEDRQSSLVRIVSAWEQLEERRSGVAAEREKHHATQKALAQVKEKHDNAQRISILRKWIQAKAEEKIRSQGDQIIAGLQKKATTADQAFRVAEQNVQRAMMLLGAGATVLIVGLVGVGLFFTVNIFFAATSAVVTLIGLALTIVGRSRHRKAVVERKLADKEKVEREQLARDEMIRQETLMGKEAPNMQELLNQLSELGWQVPQETQDAERLVTEIEATLPKGGTLTQLREAVKEAEEFERRCERGVMSLVAQIEGDEGRIREDLARLQLSQIEDIDAAGACMQKLANDQGKLEGKVGAVWRALEGAVEAYDLPDRATEARSQLVSKKAALDQKVKHLEERIASRKDLQEKLHDVRRNIAVDEERITQRHHEMQALGRLQDLLPDVLDLESEAALKGALQAKLSTYNRQELDAEHAEAADNTARAHERADQASSRKTAYLEEARSLVEELEATPPEPLSRDEIGRLFPEFPDVTSNDLEPLENKRMDLFTKIQNYRDQQAQLEGDLGIEGSTLDEATCADEVQELEKQKAISGGAGPILNRVRDNILQAVLPRTMEYMRGMLPMLTAGRYHDAELDDDTYKIRVWDAQAQEYIEKEIYSGATQDQFSLALRLGFALAALPQERGASPGFIFLDEPMAGFDKERRNALVELLTEGDLSIRFDQIFVVAPVGVFPVNPFPHYIRMIDGKIVQESLGIDQ